MSAKLENPAATRDGTGEPAGRPTTPAQNFDVDRAFATAIDHHRAGRLQKAAQLYAGILQARPTHPGTLHYLGMIAMQTGHELGLPPMRSLSCVTVINGRGGLMGEAALGLLQAKTALKPGTTLETDYSGGGDDFACKATLWPRGAERPGADCVKSPEVRRG